MEILAWTVLILFTIFAATPIVGIMFSDDPYITYKEAIIVGSMVLLALALIFSTMLLVAWAVSVIIL